MLKRVGSNLSSLPLRHMGGGSVSALRGNYSGAERYNQSIGDGIQDKTAGHGYGHLHPSSWLMPYKAGAMSSRNASPISFSISTLNVAQGINLSGDAPITFFATGTGQAVAALIGSTSFSFSGAGELNAPFNMVGASTITFTESGTLSGTADIAGTANITFSGSLVTGAIAHLTAVPIETALTADQIASAVWATVIEGSVTATEMMRLNHAVLAGKTDITGTTVTFRDIADTKNRLTVTMSGSERASVILDGSI